MCTGTTSETRPSYAHPFASDRAQLKRGQTLQRGILSACARERASRLRPTMSHAPTPPGCTRHHFFPTTCSPPLLHV
eukprot:13083390-Alexandrium_andersonii.AAC.1